MAAKKVLTVAHRWVGLALVVLVLLQAGTGLLLVNKAALEPLVHPEAAVAPGARACRSGRAEGRDGRRARRR